MLKTAIKLRNKSIKHLAKLETLKSKVKSKNKRYISQAIFEAKEQIESLSKFIENEMI